MMSATDVMVVLNCFRNETSHVQTMVERFKYDFRYLHVFVILFKQNDNRMTAALWNMLNMFQSMFGPEFWSNAILEATHWSHSDYLVNMHLQATDLTPSLTNAFNDNLRPPLSFFFKPPPPIIAKNIL